MITASLPPIHFFDLASIFVLRFMVKIFNQENISSEEILGIAKGKCDFSRNKCNNFY